MASDWSVGDLVWAKMRSYPWWPSMIGKPRKEVSKPAAAKKTFQFVEFFGSNTYAWIALENIKKFNPNDEHAKGSSAALKDALRAIEEHKNGRSVKEPVVEPSTPKANGVTPKKKTDSVKKKAKESPKESTPKANGVIPKKKPASLKRKSVSTDQPQSTKRSASEKSTPTSSNESTTAKRFGFLMESVSNCVSGQSSDYGWAAQMSAIVNRPEVEDPEFVDLNFHQTSTNIMSKDITPSTDLRIGFIGLGTMGGCIAKNLVDTKHKVTVWNRDPRRSDIFKKNGASVAETPGDVVNASDVTFCCVSGPAASKEIFFGNCGVLQQMTDGKGYVEMTSIDANTSRDIADAIRKKGGRYLEAPVQGSSELAKEGQLVILAAGDNQLFETCKSSFEAIGEHAFFLGEVGNASKMNIIVNLLLGDILASLSEAMSLAKRNELSQENLLEILRLSPMNCALVLAKARCMINDTFPTNTPLMHVQKDLQMAINMGNDTSQPLPTTSAANEVFKHAKRIGYGSHDASAVYRTRF